MRNNQSNKEWKKDFKKIKINFHAQLNILCRHNNFERLKIERHLHIDSQGPRRL